MKHLALFMPLALILGGCANTKELSYSSEGAMVSTVFWNSDTAQVIQVGSPERPYAGKPAVKIKVDGAVLFDSARSAPEVVAAYLAQNTSREADRYRGFAEHPSPKHPRSEKTWGEGARHINLLEPGKRTAELTYDEARRQGVSVIVQDGRIKAIRITDFRGKSDASSIQLTVDRSRWMKSRLSREECALLFGRATEESAYFTQ